MVDLIDRENLVLEFKKRVDLSNDNHEETIWRNAFLCAIDLTRAQPRVEPYKFDEKTLTILEEYIAVSEQQRRMTAFKIETKKLIQAIRQSKKGE